MLRCCAINKQRFLRSQRGSQRIVSKHFLHIYGVRKDTDTVCSPNCTQSNPQTIHNTSWINMGFPGDEYLLLCELIYPLRQNQPLKTEE